QPQRQRLERRCIELGCELERFTAKTRVAFDAVAAHRESHRLERPAVLLLNDPRGTAHRAAVQRAGDVVEAEADAALLVAEIETRRELTAHPGAQPRRIDAARGAAEQHA